jgi:hypothetical protein
VEQKERQYAVADAATEQSYWPTDIMSAEVRDCWQNSKGCREPTKCNRGNTRKPSDSQRHDESHQSEENNVLDESHAAICCIMRQRWAPGSISVEIRRFHSRYGQVHRAARTQINGALARAIQLPANIVVFPAAKPIVFANLTLKPILGDGIG